VFSLNCSDKLQNIKYFKIVQLSAAGLKKLSDHVAF
jgi:hypothetical protein